VRVGKVGFGTYTLIEGFERGLPFRRVSPSRTLMSDDRDRTTVTRSKYTEIEGSLVPLQDADGDARAIFSSVYEEVGSDLPFFVAVDDADPNQWLYARLDSEDALAALESNVWQHQTVHIVEEL
jgi:hypothetical protein